MADIGDRIGTWRTISWTREVERSGAIADVMGPDPTGYVASQADGRMTATVFKSERLASCADRRTSVRGGEGPAFRHDAVSGPV